MTTNLLVKIIAVQNIAAQLNVLWNDKQATEKNLIINNNYFI